MHEKKGIFCHTKSVAMTPKSHDHMPSMSVIVTLGSRCKMANSSSEDETDTLLERPTRIQPYQFDPLRQDFKLRVSFEAKPHVVFLGVCKIALTEVLTTQMGMMWHSKKVR